MDNAFYVDLALGGKLPSNEELTALFGSEIKVVRKGDRSRTGRVYTHTIAWMPLAEWEVKSTADYQNSHTPLEQAAHAIRQLTPKLLMFHQPLIKKYIRIDLAVRSWQGAFELPINFIQAVSEAGLTIYVSWLADFDDDDDESDNKPDTEIDRR